MREATPREPSSKVDPRRAALSLPLEVASRAASQPPGLPLLLRLPLRTLSGELLKLPRRLRLPRRGLPRLRCWGERGEGGP